MPRYVALLRGINVGGHRVTMATLRRHVAALKFARIDTFIASGNVLFDTASDDVAALEAKIERQLARTLGYAVPTFIRTLPELAGVLSFRPFAPEDATNKAYSRYVLFLRTPLDETLQHDIAAVSCATDVFRAHGREIHWLCRGKLSDDTPAAKAFGQHLRTARVDVTSRNIKMLQRLIAQEMPAADTPAASARTARRVTRAGKAEGGRSRKA